MKSKTVTVTIGRNVGSEPMPPERWHDFTADVRATVGRVVSEFWTVAPYKGEWEGMSEESMIFHGPINPDYGTTLAGTARFGSDNKPIDPVRELRAELANLATYYGQSAIGLSVGFGELVESYNVLALDKIPA